MGAKAEALAKQFEAKAQEVMAVLEKLSDADWKKVTAAEKWSVAVTAHHVATAHDPIANIVKTLAAGQSIPHFTTSMLEELNAKHAKEFANVSKAETIALYKKSVAAAAALVRSLGDEQLGKSGTVFADSPPMSAQQMITNALIGHIEEHFESIRKTVRA